MFLNHFLLLTVLWLSIIGCNKKENSEENAIAEDPIVVPPENPENPEDSEKEGTEKSDGETGEGEPLEDSSQSNAENTNVTPPPGVPGDTAPGELEKKTSIKKVSNQTFEAAVQQFKEGFEKTGLHLASSSCEVADQITFLHFHRIVTKFTDFVLDTSSDLSNFPDALLASAEAKGLEVFQLEIEKVGNSVKQNYFGIREKSPTYGLGHYLIYEKARDAEHQVGVQIPHPFFDLSTWKVGGQLGATRLPDFFIMSGRHRNCSDSISADSAPGNYSSSKSYKISDPSHYSYSFFNAAHTAMSDYAETIFQIHGFAGLESDPNINVILSTGANSIITSKLQSLKVAFQNQSLQPAIYPTDIQSLGATSNVQGFVSRPIKPDQFIHVELAAALRNDPIFYPKIIAALLEVVP